MVEKIIKQNLEKMISIERGGMMGLLMSESMGGNAGSWQNAKGKKFSCTAANFFYDENEKTIIFENSQDVNPEIKEKYFFDTFRLAVSLFKSGFKLKIIEGPYRAVGKAREVLEETINAYNKTYGFED